MDGAFGHFDNFCFMDSTDLKVDQNSFPTVSGGARDIYNYRNNYNLGKSKGQTKILRATFY